MGDASHTQIMPPHILVIITVNRIADLVLLTAIHKKNNHSSFAYRISAWKSDIQIEGGKKIVRTFTAFTLHSLALPSAGLLASY